MKFQCYFSKIYMRKNWLEIWYSCTNLVTFVIAEALSKKIPKKKKFTNTQSRM